MNSKVKHGNIVCTCMNDASKSRSKVWGVTIAPGCPFCYQHGYCDNIELICKLKICHALYNHSPSSSLSSYLLISYKLFLLVSHTSLIVDLRISFSHAQSILVLLSSFFFYVGHTQLTMCNYIHHS